MTKSVSIFMKGGPGWYLVRGTTLEIRNHRYGLPWFVNDRWTKERLAECPTFVKAKERALELMREMQS